MLFEKYSKFRISTHPCTLSVKTIWTGTFTTNELSSGRVRLQQILTNQPFLFQLLFSYTYQLHHYKLRKTMGHSVMKQTWKNVFFEMSGKQVVHSSEHISIGVKSLQATTEVWMTSCYSWTGKIVSLIPYNHSALYLHTFLVQARYLAICRILGSIKFAFLCY